MQPRLLTRFEPFEQLDYSALTTLARHCRMLTLPAGRLLLEPGRPASGSYYLARGRLRMGSGARAGEQIEAGTPRARRPIQQAGEAAARIVTVTPAGVLHVDLERVGFLLDGGAGRGYRVEHLTHIGGGDWLRVFLAGIVGRCLRLDELEELLGAARPVNAVAGATLVHEGEPGSGLYLIERGRAVVLRGGRRVAELGAGGFFGEEALLRRRPRNATVTMIEAGRLHFITAELFERLVVPAVVAARAGPVAAAGAEAVIDLDRPPWRDGDLRSLARRLPPERRYRLAGGTAGARRHAAFLLAHLGLEVRLADAGAGGRDGGRGGMANRDAS